MRNRFNASSTSILQKTNRLLQIILCSFLLIGFRIWHLAVIQSEEKNIEAQKPRRRTVMQRAHRGMIVDRFGTPLAINKICYHAAIETSQFAHIPTVVWKTDMEGKRIRTMPRKEHIRNLSELLGKELKTDPSRIEDLIYSKASLFPHIPYTIKSNITEEQYYRLKALEREWPGLAAEIGLERTYPLGKVGSTVLGYLGAINREEILTHANELNELQKTMFEGSDDPALLQKIQEMKDRAYTLNDLIGKSGIEKQMETRLRGISGKKIFEINHKGACIREIPEGRETVAGETIALSLSAELQKFCEELLIQAEKTREGRCLGIDPETKTRAPLKQPWIKGGAIVALDPNTGEVLALASTPRFDPNDFILTSNREEKNRAIHRWQETDQLIANLWDGKELLFRERPGPQKEERISVSWEFYLQEILPEKTPLRSCLQRANDLKTAIQLQEDFEALLYLTCSESSKVFDLPLTSLSSEAALIRGRFDSFFAPIPKNCDRLFFLDLLRLAVYAPAFTDDLITKLGSLTLSHHRSLTQSFQRIERCLRIQCKELFHFLEFQNWREKHQKDFLRDKRQEEKEKKTYARPYLDYLDKQERLLFEEFWQANRLQLIAALLKKDPSFLPISLTSYFERLDLEDTADWTSLRTTTSSLTLEETEQYFKTMRSFHELSRTLWSDSSFLRGKKGERTERELAAAFYPRTGFGFCRSHAFQNAAPLGSLFKLVTAYEALRQHGGSLPFFLFDEVHIDNKSNSLIVGFTADRKPLHRHYKGGRLPRSHLPNVGKVDLIGALEQSSNPYFALLASDFLSEGTDLASAAASFGFGERTGIDLPAEIPGRLPSDLKTNRTGLYSFAIGQHTFLATPLQAARCLGALANGGYLFAPTLTQQNEEGRTLPLPKILRNTLFEGMDRVLWGPKGNARPSLIRGLAGNPISLRQFLSLQHQMIGKTSTAEILCRSDYVPSTTPHMYKHIWFGAISFSPEETRERWSSPELVVVVHLRYGDGGKEAAPLAAQVIHKWRQIQAAHCSK